jgi:hypothetical protein
MNGGLWYESIRQWQSQNATNEASASQKEEVPMETCGLLQWELPRLRRERRHVMIVVEQQHHQKPKGDRDEDPLHIQVPKVNDPVPVLRRLEGAYDGYAIDFRSGKAPGEVVETDPEEGWESKGVVGEDAADPGFSKRAGAELLEAVDGAKVEDRDDDGEIASGESGGFKEVDEFLYAFDCRSVSVRGGKRVEEGRTYCSI